jgi:putative MATE family efflux protein
MPRRPPSPPREARFVTVSTMRHVVVMTATGAVGLMSLFLVDAANLLYISLLGDPALTAAIGFAATLQFFTISLSIGLSIAATATVSRAVGQGDWTRARSLGASSAAILVASLGVAGAGLWVWREEALALLGAEGRALEAASGYLAIVLPSVPLIGVAMVTSGLLRAVGDARRAMFVTLGGGVVGAAIDPVFIFALDLGVTGAAMAAVLTRVMAAATGLVFAIRVHDLMGRLSGAAVIGDARAILAIAGPVVLTQLSTPFGYAYLMAIAARSGEEAAAGWAVLSRITPLLFGGIFALSGAVGPILGQNWGAGETGRVLRAFRDAAMFAALYVGVVWALLGAGQGLVVEAFGLTGAGVEVVEAFAAYGAGAYVCAAWLFVANAAFNNLGRPAWSMAANWTRDAAVIPLLALTLPAIPAPESAVAIQALAGAAVGLAALALAHRHAARLDAAPALAPAARSG